MATTTIPLCPPAAMGRRREEEVVGRRILVFWARGARGAGRVAPGGRGWGREWEEGERGKRGGGEGWGCWDGDGGDGGWGVGWWRSRSIEDVEDLLGVGSRLLAR